MGRGFLPKCYLFTQNGTSVTLALAFIFARAIREGQLSTYDKEVLKRIDDIEQLPEDDKNHLFYLIDNLVKASKLKAL